MWRVPADPDGLTMPRGVPLEVMTSVVALQRACAACAAALEVLDGASSLAQEWSGGSAEAFRGRRAVLSRRCDDLGSVTAGTVAALQRWGPEAAGDRDAMGRAAAAIREVQVREHAAVAAGRSYAPEITADGDVAWRDWSLSKQRYWDGVARLAQTLRALVPGITDRPLTVGDHTQAFIGRLWDDAVAAPALALWSLTGEAFVDRDRWRSTVQALPGQIRDGAAAVVHDPVAAAGALVDAPAWHDGRTGEAAGAVAAILVPAPRWLRLGPEQGFLRIPRRLLDPHAPLPPLQTVDELLREPDLARQEHAARGHTLSRHVDVDDAFLMDRLRHGTVDELTGVRTFSPRDASRFTDLATAQAAIGAALRANEPMVRAFAGSRADVLELTFDAGHPVGTVIRPSGGAFEALPSSVVAVQLRRSPEGRVYVGTAFAKWPN